MVDLLLLWGLSWILSDLIFFFLTSDPYLTGALI